MREVAKAKSFSKKFSLEVQRKRGAFITQMCVYVEWIKDGLC